MVINIYETKIAHSFAAKAATQWPWAKLTTCCDDNMVTHIYEQKMKNIYETKFLESTTCCDDIMVTNIYETK